MSDTQVSTYNKPRPRQPRQSNVYARRPAVRDFGPPPFPFPLHPQSHPRYPFQHHTPKSSHSHPLLYPPFPPHHLSTSSLDNVTPHHTQHTFSLTATRPISLPITRILQGQPISSVIPHRSNSRSHNPVCPRIDQSIPYSAFPHTTSSSENTIPITPFPSPPFDPPYPPTNLFKHTLHLRGRREPPGRSHDNRSVSSVRPVRIRSKPFISPPTHPFIPSSTTPLAQSPWTPPSPSHPQHQTPRQAKPSLKHPDP